MAFGDSANDVSMLHWAGLSYAMGSGEPLAKQAARFLAPSHACSGVAAVLEQWEASP